MANRRHPRGNDAERARAFVAASVEIIQRRLVLELQIDAAAAEEIARNCAHDICADYGGRYMYVPKDLEFKLTKRDLEIFNRFNGANLHQMVEHYGVTHTRIYQIVAAVKATMLAKMQAPLPFDPPKP